MGVRKDCRHYSTRSTPTGDVLQRCRLTANTEMPFACPEDCLFFEPRSLSNAGWQRFERAEDGDLWGEGYRGEPEDGAAESDPPGDATDDDPSR